MMSSSDSSNQVIQPVRGIHCATQNDLRRWFNVWYSEETRLFGGDVPSNRRVAFRGFPPNCEPPSGRCSSCCGSYRGYKRLVELHNTKDVLVYTINMAHYRQVRALNSVLLRGMPEVEVYPSTLYNLFNRNNTLGYYNWVKSRDPLMQCNPAVGACACRGYLVFCVVFDPVRHAPVLPGHLFPLPKNDAIEVEFVEPLSRFVAPSLPPGVHQQTPDMVPFIEVASTDDVGMAAAASSDDDVTPVYGSVSAAMAAIDGGSIRVPVPCVSIDTDEESDEEAEAEDDDDDEDYEDGDDGDDDYTDKGEAHYRNVGQKRPRPSPSVELVDEITETAPKRHAPSVSISEPEPEFDSSADSSVPKHFTPVSILDWARVAVVGIAANNAAVKRAVNDPHLNELQTRMRTPGAGLVSAPSMNLPKEVARRPTVESDEGLMNYPEDEDNYTQSGDSSSSFNSNATENMDHDEEETIDTSADETALDQDVPMEPISEPLLAPAPAPVPAIIPEVVQIALPIQEDEPDVQLDGEARKTALRNRTIMALGFVNTLKTLSARSYVTDVLANDLVHPDCFVPFPSISGLRMLSKQAVNGRYFAKVYGNNLLAFVNEKPVHAPSGRGSVYNLDNIPGYNWQQISTVRVHVMTTECYVCGIGSVDEINALVYFSFESPEELVVSLDADDVNRHVDSSVCRTCSLFNKLPHPNHSTRLLSIQLCYAGVCGHPSDNHGLAPCGAPLRQFFRVDPKHPFFMPSVFHSPSFKCKISMEQLGATRQIVSIAKMSISQQPCAEKIDAKRPGLICDSTGTILEANPSLWSDNDRATGLLDMMSITLALKIFWNRDFDKVDDILEGRMGTKDPKSIRRAIVLFMGQFIAGYNGDIMESEYLTKCAVFIASFLVGHLEPSFPENTTPHQHLRAFVGCCLILRWFGSNNKKYDRSIWKYIVEGDYHNNHQSANGECVLQQPFMREAVLSQNSHVWTSPVAYHNFEKDTTGGVLASISNHFTLSDVIRHFWHVTVAKLGAQPAAAAAVTI